MVVPVTLIEPMDVTIEQIDKASAPPPSDVIPGGIDGRKWPINYVPRKTEIILEAQVVFGNVDQDTGFSQMGASEEQKGYLVLRFQDLKDKNIKLNRGDKITKLKTKKGTLDVEFFLLHSSGDMAAHIGGSFALTRIEFQDRKPEGP